MKNRRKLLIGLGATALAPRAVFAQAKQAPVLIGWLHAGSRESFGQLFAVFRESLTALRSKEGAQLVFEERWADGRPDALTALAGEVTAKQPAIIVAVPGPAAAAAGRAAPKTPIVTIGGNPVAAGLAASLARPGGMVTGIASLTTDVSEKYLELLLAAAPKMRRIGFLADTTSATFALFMANIRRSVAQHAVEARISEVARVEEIEPALARMARERVQGLVVLPSSGIFHVDRRRVVNFALEQRWPAIGSTTEWAEEGTLLSYGVNSSENYRRAAYFVDRILKGSKPGELPIEQPTKIELVLNMRTAKALGLALPQSFLIRADRVIG